MKVKTWEFKKIYEAYKAIVRRLFYSCLWQMTRRMEGGKISTISNVTWCQKQQEEEEEEDREEAGEDPF